VPYRPGAGPGKSRPVLRGGIEEGVADQVNEQVWTTVWSPTVALCTWLYTLRQAVRDGPSRPRPPGPGTASPGWNPERFCLVSWLPPGEHHPGGSAALAGAVFGVLAEALGPAPLYGHAVGELLHAFRLVAIDGVHARIEAADGAGVHLKGRMCSLKRQGRWNVSITSLATRGLRYDLL
jgi:hypothetical protein